jgi:hypothetical protein
MRTLLKYWLLTMTAGGVLMAQHGGGHHGGGGGSFGGGGGFASRPSAPAYGGFNSGRAAPPSFGAQPRSYGYGGTYGNPGRYGSTVGPNRINRTLGRRYGYYGLAYYPAFGYGDSWYDPSYYPPYDQYASGEQYPQSGLMQAPAVETMGNGYYPQAPYDAAPAVPYGAPDAPPAPAAPIVVVLKNGQKVEMQSYGIMNGLLWDFSRPNSRRIPLASIDVAASVKASEAVGGSFPEEFFAVNPN